jgi:hypothetical protein
MIRRALPGDGKWEGEFNERAVIAARMLRLREHTTKEIISDDKKSAESSQLARRLRRRLTDKC